AGVAPLAFDDEGAQRWRVGKVPDKWGDGARPRARPEGGRVRLPMRHEMPPAPAPRRLAPLVGRDEERRAAEQAVARGAGGVVWTGGPGAGKSHLLDHVAERLAEQGT